MWKICLILAFLLSLPAAMPDVSYANSTNLNNFNEVESAGGFRRRDERCSGGQVMTPTGTVLDCPSGGGPRCKTDQECVCVPVANPGGGYGSKNDCLDPVPDDDEQSQN